MLTPHDIAEMRALVERVSVGSVSREDWAALAALTVIAQGDATVAAIAARGLDAFIAVSRPIFEGHAFHPDDFRRMYARICAAARPAVRH